MTFQKKITLGAGWLVFAIAMIVYYFSAERVGSLWDCGEFILGAYKLQVVHPPGAPLFLTIGRLFAWVGDVTSSNPSDIAFAVNLMSGMLTAFAAAFVAWSTMTFVRLSFVGRDEKLNNEQTLVTAGAGLVAGLTTAFCSSVWFSAVEGEVYAMSTFFTAMTVWAMVKWYGLPKQPEHDKYIIFAVYSAGLSIGVHLLSLLTFPALALLYYLKKAKKVNFWGGLAATAVGSILIPVIQKMVITGIPAIWSQFELLCVNTFGMPFHSGLFPTVLLLAGIGAGGLYMAHKRKNALLQKAMMSMIMLVIGFSSIGVVLIRANANPPINMNAPSDVMRLIPYLNREQYGERPLFRGPHFDAHYVSVDRVDRYGQVGDRYEVVDHRVSYEYQDSDKMLLPRIGHNDTNRPQLHRQWMQYTLGDRERPPDMVYNLAFMMKYQIGWMYIRYFMWNFTGRQNGEQGFYAWNNKSGHWLSGVKPIDSARLYNQSELPDTMKHHKARNRYYFLPFIFGLIGLIWQLRTRRNDWAGLLVLFLFTGLGIIFYSNQPPNEPRERDYVLIGSFFTFCMWIGMAVPAIYGLVKKRWAEVPGRGVAIGTLALVLIAPVIMGFENFDDHSRRHHEASRDYASNLLNSCEPNAIIFTYGDNDTYPLWYAQEVEGIRTDVRVVNLSLIAVDWYIEGMRRKVNDSEAIKLTIPRSAYRGDARNVLLPIAKANQEYPLDRALNIMGGNHPVQSGTASYPSYLPSTNLYIPIDRNRAVQSGLIDANDVKSMVTKIPITLNKGYITKDEMAILDVIMSNIYDRPIYFSVTCREDRFMGLQDYTELQGMGLRILPVRNPSNDGFFIYGSGRIDLDATYDRIVNRWKWGNFDTMDLHVDGSYAASVQAQQMIMWRTIAEYLAKGDNQKAIDVTDKHFEAFPHMNFPYTARTAVYIDPYVRTQQYDKAKYHLRILAHELAQFMKFYDSLSQEDLLSGFRQDHNVAMTGVQQSIRMAQQVNDPAFAEEIEGILGSYLTQNVRN